MSLTERIYTHLDVLLAGRSHKSDLIASCMLLGVLLVEVILPPNSVYKSGISNSSAENTMRISG